MKVGSGFFLVVATVAVFFVTHPVFAQLRLTKAKAALEDLKADLTVLVPIAAAVILICLAISYAGRFIDKSTFLRWSVGVIVAGSAWELAKMLLNQPV
ncbi:VirB2 family type IV secretion system major pilin TrwL [Bartonella sp. CB178]|uniref:VirB2 family type IV secretion system major pilin TrwL n=1 Tax=Bartonella sp. CB178 TaxID=3112255 RepID=UPI00300DC094